MEYLIYKKKREENKEKKFALREKKYRESGKCMNRM